MNYETLKKSHKKEIVISLLAFILIVIAIVFATTRAKFKTTDSVSIAKGTFNYKIGDMNIVAMYDENNNEIDVMPETGYTINESKSYCAVGGSKDTNARLYTMPTGEHVMSKIKKNSKCYLYFDAKPITVTDIIVSLNAKTTAPNFETIATTDEGVYATSDGMYGGTSYYYRGSITNNYVKFAGFYWRIIRFNGDGSIRLIYQGTTEISTGTHAQIQRSAYNSTYNRSEYVGFTYTEGSQRTTEGTASTIKGVLDNWYNINLASHASKIADGKYCNDRNTASGSSWSSQPSSKLYYAPNERAYTTHTPTLACGNSGDIYTLKVGLITIDEAYFAGGYKSTANSNYYLYTGQTYWTMSPYYWFNDSSNNMYANVFVVYSNGRFGMFNVSAAYGVRPVINLKSDTTFQVGGDGTASNPYEVL